MAISGLSVAALIFASPLFSWWALIPRGGTRRRRVAPLSPFGDGARTEADRGGRPPLGTRRVPAPVSRRLLQGCSPSDYSHTILEFLRIPKSTPASTTGFRYIRMWRRRSGPAFCADRREAAASVPAYSTQFPFRRIRSTAAASSTRPCSRRASTVFLSRPPLGSRARPRPSRPQPGRRDASCWRMASRTTAFARRAASYYYGYAPGRPPATVRVSRPGVAPHGSMRRRTFVEGWS